MCEDECEWYHPNCVGFEEHIFDEKVKFVCPFCKDETKARIAQLAERGLYVKIESTFKDKKYIAYTAASSQAKEKSPDSEKKRGPVASPHSTK